MCRHIIYQLITVGPSIFRYNKINSTYFKQNSKYVQPPKESCHLRMLVRSHSLPKTGTINCPQRYFFTPVCVTFWHHLSPVSNLQVTGVIFSDVAATSLTVSWTFPAASSDINILLVTWTAINGGTQFSLTLNNSALTSVSISTNITPGRAYTFFVVSRNTQTQTNDTRETSTSSQQAASE